MQGYNVRYIDLDGEGWTREKTRFHHGHLEGEPLLQEDAELLLADLRQRFPNRQYEIRAIAGEPKRTVFYNVWYKAVITGKRWSDLDAAGLKQSSAAPLLFSREEAQDLLSKYPVGVKHYYEIRIIDPDDHSKSIEIPATVATPAATTTTQPAVGKSQRYYSVWNNLADRWIDAFCKEQGMGQVITDPFPMSLEEAERFMRSFTSKQDAYAFEVREIDPNNRSKSIVPEYYSVWHVPYRHWTNATWNERSKELGVAIHDGGRNVSHVRFLANTNELEYLGSNILDERQAKPQDTPPPAEESSKESEAPVAASPPPAEEAPQTSSTVGEMVALGVAAFVGSVASGLANNASKKSIEDARIKPPQSSNDDSNIEATTATTLEGTTV